MRRVWLVAALIVALAGPAPAAPRPAATPAVEHPIRTIALIVNGQPLTTDTPPIVRDGRLLLPVRAIFEALGIPLRRVGDGITARLPVGNLSMAVGSSHATVDSRAVELDAPVSDIAGTTYVSLRLLKAAFGANVTYDQRGAKVEIVSAMLGRATGAEERRSDGGTTVNGTVAALDANSVPPALTVTQGDQSRTISISSDARVTIEDVTVHSQVKAVLADLRVGDRVAIVLSKDGRVVEIHDFYSSDNGTLTAVSALAVVLQNGKVIQPGRTSDITLNGAPAKLGDLLVGDSVTVRRNPETGEIRQLIASRAGGPVPTAQPSAAAVQVTGFSTTISRPLHAGEKFDVTLVGTPGGHASFDIGDYLSSVELHEESPGVYKGSFTIPDRFNVAQVPIYGHLSVGSSQSARAQASGTLSAATIPPQIPEVAPPPGETVNNPRPSIYATFLAPGAIPISASSVSLSVNGHDVTSSATRTASFITYRPGVDLPPGDVKVTVKVADAAGNTVSRSWTFTIGAR
jgi:hypothetical protein